METIFNLLILSDAQRTAFREAAPDYEQVFAPGGTVPETGKALTGADYARAGIILGNPPPEALRECRGLRMLHTRTAGCEKYETPGVLPPGTKLYNASGAYGHTVSEHMLALLLALMKRLPAYRDQQRKGCWEDRGKVKSLLDARVLCVGTGDLGSSFALSCKALGAKTLGVRRNPGKPAAGIDAMYGSGELDRLLPSADVVALMLPHNAGTAHLMDRRRLLLMKPDAILLNGGRGTAVDCGALAVVLAEGHLWGAGLDVTDPEPLPPDHPLWRQDRALITPHAAGDDHLPDTMDRVAEIALRHLKEYLAQ